MTDNNASETASNNAASSSTKHSTTTNSSDAHDAPNHTISESARRGILPHLTDDGTENNYTGWVTKSTHLLRGWGLWKYINGPLSAPPAIPTLRDAKPITAPDKDGVEHTVIIPSNLEEHQKKTQEAEPWMEANDLALSKIINAIPHSQLHLVEDAKYARVAWLRLHFAYRPRNSIRASNLRSDITGSQCTPDMDVGQWITHVNELYSSLCILSRSHMSQREFVNSLIDNMPKSDVWTQFVSGLRDRLSDYEEAGKAVTALEFTTRIKEENWQRTRKNPNAPSLAFSANSSGKRPRQNSSNASASSSSSNKRQRADRTCTNQHCRNGKGHTIENCFAYGGGKQGRYESWWRGPWNIHLPPDQRTTANNVRPASLFPPSTATTSPTAAQFVAPMQLPQPTSLPLQSPQTLPFAHSSHATPTFLPSTPYTHSDTNPQPGFTYSLPQTYPVPHAYSIPQPYYTPFVPTRADTTHSTFTTDDKSTINFATTNETPHHAWSIQLGNEPIVASLPVLDNSLPCADTCHHDSGANRHVFHDRSAFETYQSIQPVQVKGFGHNLSTTAIGRGTVRVNGRYGTRVSPIVLHNVLHIPAARSNLISGPQLDLAGVSSLLGDGLATLSIRGENVVGGALHNDMYRLNMSIVRPDRQRPIFSRIDPSPPSSRITPIAAAASSDQAGFYIA